MGAPTRTKMWDALAAMLVACGPALSMTIGSAAAFCVSSENATFQASMQNFSAGLLIAAISGELFPMMRNDGEHAKKIPEWQSFVGVSAGFFLGILFMYSVKVFCEGMEGEEGEDEDEDDGSSDDEPGETSRIELGEMKYESIATTEGTAMNVFPTPLAHEEHNAWMDGFGQDLDTIASSVSQMRQLIEAPNIDEDNFDAVVHHLMSQVDSMNRHVFAAEKFSDANRKRILFHVLQLELALQDLRAADSLTKVGLRVKDFERILHHIHEHSEREDYARWRMAPRHKPRWGGPPGSHSKPLRQTGFSSGKEDILGIDTADNVTQAEQKSVPIPWGLVAAITVDGAVDGLLIGLSYSVSTAAGITMAIATCIEMGFTGFAFAMGIKEAMETRSSTTKWLITMVPPVAIVLVGFAGAALGSALEDNRGVLIGLIAFSVVAILFLVTHELLCEAFELQHGEVLWYVNVWLFLGLYAGIMTEKIMSHI